MEAVRIAVLPEQRVLEERERDDVGGRELVAEEEVAAGEQILEDRQRARDQPLELGDARAVRLRLPSSATIRFGGRFQTRLNQSTNSRSSARRAGSAG